MGFTKAGITRNIIYSLCFIILCLAVASTLFYLNIDTSVSNSVKLINYIFMLSLIGVISYAATVINEANCKVFVLLLGIVSILAGTLWNIYASTLPVSDYEVLIKGAERIANGTFREGFDKTSYFYIFNYQIGYTAYIALIVKISGMNLVWLKLLEVLYMSGSAILVYLICKNLYNHRIASVAAVLYATFIFNILGSSVINNQHLSTFLMLVGIYLLTIKKYWAAASAGVVFAVMNAVRPIGIVVLTGIVILYLYNTFKKLQRRKCIFELILIMFSFYISVFAIDEAFILSNITPNPISKNNVPYFKFVIGLGADNGSLFGNKTEDAIRTNVYFDLKSVGFDYEKYNDDCLAYIKQRINDYKNTTAFLINKVRFFLGDRDYQYIFALEPKRQSEEFVNYLVFTAHVQYLLLLIIAASAFAIKLRKKTDLNIFPILMLGFIFVHFLIEAQTRYRYEFYIFIVVLSAGPVCQCIDKVREVIGSKFEHSVNG